MITRTMISDVLIGASAVLTVAAAALLVLGAWPYLIGLGPIRSGLITGIFAVFCGVAGSLLAGPSRKVGD